MQGDRLLEEGLQVLDLSGFVPLRLYALHRIYHFCSMFPPKPQLHRKYAGKFTDELKQSGLERLNQPLEALLRQFVETL